MEGRTRHVNKSTDLIYLINRTLKHKKTGSKRSFSSHSGTVPPTIKRSNEFLDDLKKIAALDVLIKRFLPEKDVKRKSKKRK